MEPEWPVGQMCWERSAHVQVFLIFSVLVHNCWGFFVLSIPFHFSQERPCSFRQFLFWEVDCGGTGGSWGSRLDLQVLKIRLNFFLSESWVHLKKCKSCIIMIQLWWRWPATGWTRRWAGLSTLWCSTRPGASRRTSPLRGSTYLGLIFVVIFITYTTIKQNI